MRGKIKFHYLNESGEEAVVTFNNADYSTSQEDLINAGTLVGSSVLTNDNTGEPSPLTFMYASGTIETILASNPD